MNEKTLEHQSASLTHVARDEAAAARATARRRRLHRGGGPIDATAIVARLRAVGTWRDAGGGDLSGFVSLSKVHLL